MADPKQDYRALARQLAEKYGLDPNIFERQINQESGFNPDAVSPMGATGIAQFMPSHWNQGQFDPFDPIVSLEKSAQLMSSHLANYGGDISKALAAYNAGRGNLAQFGDNLGAMLGYTRPGTGVQPFAETQRYLERILGGTAMHEGKPHTDDYTPNATEGGVHPLVGAVNRLMGLRAQAQRGTTGGGARPGDVGFAPGFGDKLGGMSTGQPLDLLNRAAWNSGMNPTSPNPMIQALMRQAGLFATLNGLMGGSGMLDLLQSGQISQAFDKGAIDRLMQKALGMTGRGGGGAATYGYVPGNANLTPAQQQAAGLDMMAGIDPNGVLEMFGTGGTQGPLDRQMVDAAGGPDNFFTAQLKDNPRLIQGLLSMMSWGNAGMSEALPKYYANQVEPYWQAFGPELQKDVNRNVNPYETGLDYIMSLLTSRSPVKRAGG